MANVFVSYSHKDADFVISIIDVIKRNGHNVDIDKDFLSIGDRLVPEIEKKIRNSDFVIVFLSTNSINSEWVAREMCHSLLTEFRTGNGIIVPCIIDRFDKSLLPEAFSKFDRYERLYLDFSKDDADKDVLINELLQRLSNRDKKEFHEFHMDLELGTRGLSIYITGPGLNWGKDPSLKYLETLSGYLLFGVKKEDIGICFKHFVVCDEEDSEVVRRMISGPCEVTGVGSPDAEPGKWRVWFCRRDYPIVGDSRDNKWN